MKKQQSVEHTYESAWSELQVVVGQLQDGSTSIDELTEKIEHAADLVKFCRERLRRTEEAVERLTQ